MLASLGVGVRLYRPVENKESVGVTYSSPVDITADAKGERLYVVEHTANRISVLRTADLTIERRIDLPLSPSGIALSEAKRQIYITCGKEKGKVLIYDLDTFLLNMEINVGHTPCSPILSHDSKNLYVCNRFDNDVSIIDLQAGTTITKVPVSREPVDSILSSDGTHLFVAGLLPDFVVSPYPSSVIAVINLKANVVVEIIPFPKGATSLRGLCFSSDEKYIYATHLVGRYKLPTTRVSGGWVNTNAVTVIDSQSFNPVATVLLDDVDRGAANPCDIMCVPIKDNKMLAISLTGTDELMLIDEAQMLSRIENVFSMGLTDNDTVNDLTFLSGLKQRVSLHGSGPMGICFGGRKIYVCNYFSDTISVFDTVSNNLSDIALSEESAMTKARKGEMLFNTARICFQQWQSCASCHPDGRTDSLSWDLLNDGIGNPKDTKSLLLSHKTPPVMALGVRANAEMAVRSGMKYILMSDMSEENAEAIDEYLKNMQPEVSPYSGHENAEKILLGAEVFNKLGCVKCHSSELYTDLKLHNVKTGKGKEIDAEFDTPTLVETWRTAPYFHDGSQKDIKGVVKHHLSSGYLDNNKAENISNEDIELLELYVNSR